MRHPDVKNKQTETNVAFSATKYLIKIVGATILSNKQDHDHRCVNQCTNKLENCKIYKNFCRYRM